MLIAEYTVNLSVVSVRKNTANYLKVGQQLLGLTLKVNP